MSPPQGIEAPSQPLRCRSRKASFAVSSLRQIDTNFSPIVEVPKDSDLSKAIPKATKAPASKFAPESVQLDANKSTSAPRRYKSFPEAVTVLSYYENENELYKATGEVDALDTTKVRKGLRRRKERDDESGAQKRLHESIIGSINYKKITLLGSSWVTAFGELVAGELRLYSGPSASPSERFQTIHLHKAVMSKISAEKTLALKRVKSVSGRAREMLASSFSSRNRDDPRYACRFQILTSDGKKHTLHTEDSSSCQEWMKAIAMEIEGINERKEELIQRTREKGRRHRRESIVSSKAE